uniref:Neurotransmitter-gated ion-channel transmembrane domain-containing protein n=1 Tax=Ascaris lumbricoides TaxID=6252 RepID=A0A0M3HV88_ASCLU
MNPIERQSEERGLSRKYSSIALSIDKACRYGFPAAFIVWNIAYWSYYLVMIPLSEKRIGTTVHLADNIIGCQLHTAPVTRRSGGDKKSETTPNQPKQHWSPANCAATGLSINTAVMMSSEVKNRGSRAGYMTSPEVGQVRKVGLQLLYLQLAMDASALCTNTIEGPHLTRKAAAWTYI